jgi:hypothetical protein
MVRPSNLGSVSLCVRSAERNDILDVVHGLDGSLSIGLLSVADKSETTAAAGVTVLDDDLWIGSGGFMRW